MNASTGFELILPGSVVFGRGSLARVGEQIRRLGGSRALVVTSPGMPQRPCLGQLLDSLGAAGAGGRVFSATEPEPPLDNVIDAVVFSGDNGCDIVIGLGGGSVIDVAKMTAAELKLPRIMIPTTAGSGSEVTHEAVLKVDGKKRAFVDAAMVPDVAIVDPDLVATMPARLTAACGMDALAHAIESRDSRKSSLLVRALAGEAYRLIQGNLRDAVEGVPAAQEAMSLGSLLAGMAFGNSGTSLCHALSYPLTNLGIPHGQAVSAMLPGALKFNGFDASIIAELRELTFSVGLTAGADGDPREMAEVVMRDTRHLGNNPREVAFEDVVEIYQTAGRR